MARDLSGMADPDDPRWRDQDLRPPGRTAREEPGCLSQIVIIGGAAVAGLVVVVGLAYHLWAARP